jgi:hypothetical protein
MTGRESNVDGLEAVGLGLTVLRRVERARIDTGGGDLMVRPEARRRGILLAMMVEETNYKITMAKALRPRNEQRKRKERRECSLSKVLVEL